jgi:hypothetical protein
MSQTITITLSEPLYERLQRVAELSHQPTETIIAQSLTHTLPALLEDIPIEYQPDVYPLLHMSDSDLQQEMQRVFSPDKWAEYETLLNRKKTGALTPDETRRLQKLRREADVFMFRRTYAAVLLKRRGYSLPPLSELSSLS